MQEVKISTIHNTFQQNDIYIYDNTFQQNVYHELIGRHVTNHLISVNFDFIHMKEIGVIQPADLYISPIHGAATIECVHVSRSAREVGTLGGSVGISSIHFWNSLTDCDQDISKSASC